MIVHSHESTTEDPGLSDRTGCPSADPARTGSRAHPPRRAPPPAPARGGGPYGPASPAGAPPEHPGTRKGVGPVEIPCDETGGGQPFLLLPGGGGPNTVPGFGDLLATPRGARAITPIHPAFGGPPRPEALQTVRGLAALYVALLDQLDLSDVTVVGNSIGGWIAAEMALLKSPRVSGAVIINAVGIEVPGHPIADFFSLTMDQVFQLSYYNPGPFRIDPTTLPPAAQAIAAGNRAT